MFYDEETPSYRRFGSPDSVNELRRLIAAGRLADVWQSASKTRRRQLRAAVFAVVQDLVFTRLTRPLEFKRGHIGCASGITGLEDDCLERFHNDVEAVVDDVLRHADRSIQNMEGWIMPRLTPVTVDAHRRRRGHLGALQRPRLPRWLQRELGGDAWLCELGVLMLTWVGAPATAGPALWPLDTWAERRAALTGQWTDHDRSRVDAEIERVLVAMRVRPDWFAAHVERPLGAKRPPLAPAHLGDESVGLALVEPHELDDRRLLELASAAIDAIEAGLRSDGDVHRVVNRVIRTMLGTPDVASELATIPHARQSLDEEVHVLLGDPARLDRVVAEVLDIVDDIVLARTALAAT
jgi:hypothetical protein